MAGARFAPDPGRVLSKVVRPLSRALECPARGQHRAKGLGASMASRFIARLCALSVVLGCFVEIRAGQVAIYTGTTQWITKALADQQAAICASKLDAAGIDYILIQDPFDTLTLADWVQSVTGNGEVDVLVLYGDIPADLYQNTTPDDSLAEYFLESEDGDTIINHADYMFYGVGGRNGVMGLQNLMDLPTIAMWGNNDPMQFTPKGKEIAPSLWFFRSDRPFHLDELGGEWFVEEVLAQ